ncbi:MAG: PAS domain S-box protein [Spirochaetota bacterium]|nr:PAS domain S-box protein [Spirochaetota bacterium]
MHIKDIIFQITNKRTRKIFLIAILCFFIAGWFLIDLSRDMALKNIEIQLESRLEITSSLISEVISKPQRLAKLLASEDEIIYALRFPYNSEAIRKANQKLEYFKQISDVDFAVLWTNTGLGIAGNKSIQKYRVADYSSSYMFQKSLKGEQHQYFEFGPITKERGFYGACPVLWNNKVIGIITVKISLLEEQFHMNKHNHIYLISPDGVIFLSSQKEWLYKFIYPASIETRMKIKKNLQFGNHSFEPLELLWDEVNHSVTYKNQSFLFKKTDIGEGAWHLVIFIKDKLIKQYQWIMASIVIGIFIISMLVFLFFENIQRTAKTLAKNNIQLEEKVSERTKQLHKSNTELRKKEQHLAITLNSIGDAVITTDKEGHVTLMNFVAEKLTGWMLSEAKGEHLSKVFKIVNAKTRDTIEDPVEMVINQGSIVGPAIDTLLISRDGLEYQIADRKAPILEDDGSIVGVVLVFSDLTEEYRIQKSLIEREERFKELTDLLPQTIFEADNDYNLTFINRKGIETFGYCWNDIDNGLNLDKLFFYESSKATNRYKVGIELQGFEGRNEYIAIRKDGTKFPVAVYSSSIIHETSPSGIRGIIIDITDRVKAENELRESEERFRALSNASWEGVMVHHKGVLLTANDNFFDLFQHTPDEWIGKYIFDDVFTPEDIQMMNEKIESNPEEPYEVMARKADGTDFLLSVRAKNAMYHGQKVRVASVRDITKMQEAEEEKKALELKLSRAKKMEAIGLLAGGVAHDLNNILSGIVSYPELLLMDDSLSESVREGIETIRESGLRAVAVVSDLITVARGVTIVKEPVNLNDIIKEYLKSPEFLKIKQLFPNVTFNVNLATELLNIDGSAIHIKKTIMNLVLNAAEAIIDEGIVNISTINRYVDRPIKGYDKVNIGEYAVIEVSNSGPNISKEDIERIFEPFYTKKVMGRSGTGLGLTIVWNTMVDHNGYIDITSDEAWTTFKLYFSVTREEILEKDAIVSIENYKGGGEKVLVVDDEEVQRDIACNMLSVLGYSASAVSSGEEAVAYLLNHKVDLIVLDMIMVPGINGKETYERIIKIHPGQKAVITSGYSKTEEVKKAQRLGAGEYIKKPYSLEKIAKAVKEALTNN